MLGTREETEQMLNFRRAAESLDRMSTMLALTVSPTDAQPDELISDIQMRDALRACRDCDNVDQCDAWLAVAPAGAKTPDFCPNRARFEFIHGH
ncbi:DUF6455 family protein [Oceanomicrobium pacificus]|uniref:DUF6455 domain-containing protein n=1 Tax=Oceanomicrobium pacificus TaxID=2692916 RepID=A0A6B0U1E3_9RHOB|nr:DUF6455 family protein [Oceanomicrobium pacificus]MXU64921.1 hypothetical protein [Oceanomicrobium pacificus]